MPRLPVGPLAYAVLAAERAGRLRLHVRVDERSAGFLALGLAAGSRSPVVVVTDLRHRGGQPPPRRPRGPPRRVPLVVLSADRPARAARHRGQPDDRAARHLRHQHALVGRPARAGRATGAPALLAQHGVPGPRGGDRRHRWSRARCTSTSRLREPLAPDPSAPEVARPLDGRPDGAAVGGRAAAAATGAAGGTRRSADVERTLVLVGRP